jgi:MFS family permease
MGLLSKERIVAGPGFDRWLVPPAALAIHLCIGMAYGFSVFWLPLSRAVGLREPVACPPESTFLTTLFAANCDWPISRLGWMYTLFFVFLGGSAALFGGWLERAGPRKAGLVAALCWCGGLCLSALGVHLHQIWLLWLGSGVIGGVGLGLGYISPVSTLIKWFPDRRGMATGLAIMGFGGGAMIGAPLADRLMRFYATETTVGVSETFLSLAAIYAVFMLGGAFGYRIPATGWSPEGFAPSAGSRSVMITTGHVHPAVAWKTPQFWLLWWVLCLNVTAGIGVIGMASPMLQEVFGGRLIGSHARFDDLTAAQKGHLAAIAAGFTGLLSLFNITGRIAWASLSDRLGRKPTYSLFFALGFLLYVSAPWSGHAGQVALFVGILCVIVSMYGGAFATVPAYLADLFGTQMVGAIHGRLLTAWSAAGIFGPVVVNYLREYQLAHGVERARVYDLTLYILGGSLLAGLAFNTWVRPVAAKHHMTEAEILAARGSSRAGTPPLAAALPPGPATRVRRRPLLLIGAWLVVVLPLLWGVLTTLERASVLLRR